MLRHNLVHFTGICFFSDNLIYSIDTAILLNDEELKEMIPKIGPRIKFKNWLQQQKSTGVNTVNVSNCFLYLLYLDKKKIFVFFSWTSAK